MMKKTMFLIFVGLILTLACEEPVPHILFDETDTVKVVQNKPKADNYGGTIPGLDAEVIDYTLENPYQHIPQVLQDSTITMSWDNAGFPSAKHFIIFFKSFQWDVMDRNKEKIASIIKFPLRNFQQKKDFIKRFDSIFGHDFTQEILDQNPLGIYRNKNGAMIGNDGQIWFKKIGKDYKIVEINP